MVVALELRWGLKKKKKTDFVAIKKILQAHKLPAIVKPSTDCVAHAHRAS